jgi:hypothetical protein
MASNEVIFLGARTVDIDILISFNNHLNYFHGDAAIHAALSCNNFSKKERKKERKKGTVPVTQH